MVEAKQTRKGFKETQVGLIPEEWQIKSIGEVCKIFGRIGFRGYTVNDIVLKGNGAITISPSNIQEGKMNFSKCTYLSWFKYEESPEIKIFNGDILLVKTGSTYGKTAVVTDLKEKATINPQIVVLKNIIIDNYFLGYTMGFKIVQNQINSTIVGGAIPTLSQKQVANYKFPLPPTLDEQKAIATALNDTDELIAKLEKLIEKKRAIKKGAMQELLKPKEGWETKLLEEEVEFSNGKAHEQYIDENGNYIVVNSKFVSTEGNIVKYSNKNISPLFRSEIAIVMSDIPNGRALAKCFLIDEDNKYTLNQRIGSIKPKNGNSKYFFYQLNRNYYFLSFDSGAGQTNLRKSDVLGCPICLPQTIEEQNNIAQILSDMDSEIEKLEKKLEKYRHLKQGMMQNLLTGKIRLI